MQTHRYTPKQMREGLQRLVEQSGEDIEDAETRADILIALRQLLAWQRYLLLYIAKGHTLREADRYLCGDKKPHPEHARRLLTRAEDALMAVLNNEEQTNHAADSSHLPHRPRRRRKDNAGDIPA